MKAIRLRLAWLYAGIRVQFFDKGILVDTLLKGGIQFLLMYYFWKSVFNSTPIIAGRDFETFVNYLILSLYLQLLMGYPNIHFIGSEIKSGGIVTALLRPMNYGVQIRYKNIGIALFNGLLFCPFLLVLNFRLGFVGIKGGLAFMVLGAIGILTYIQFDILMSYLTFWTENTWGITLLKNAILMFFSGKLFPIDLLGEKAYALVKYSPFSGMVFTPIQVGLNAGEGIVFAGLLQMAWLILLMMLSRLLFARAQNEVMINGG